jgi:uroporphyrinogen decarboxylase
MLCLVIAMTTPETSAFQGPLHSGAAKTALRETATSQEGTSSSGTSSQDPLLIRAARGEKTERTPVWMMRQAGRHIKEYRDLCKEYPTFRQRSEIAEVAVEISLQPWRNYQTDGCILFSDILTPLPGMGCEFTIDEKVGPLMSEPIRSYDDMKKVMYLLVDRSGMCFLLMLISHHSSRLSTNLPPFLSKQMHPMDPFAAAPFVREALEELRKQVGPETAVLGFVGCPYTLATYLVEGKSSKEYLEIKKMALNEPALLKAILQQLADSIGDYAVYQIESGAQLIQIFDSWAGYLSPRDYDEFAAPYQKQILDKIKKTHPEVPTVIYIKHWEPMERMRLRVRYRVVD